MDSIEDYEGNELQWAVDTALSPIFEIGEDAYAKTPEALVDDAWDVIEGGFEDVGRDPPDRLALVEAVRVALRDHAMDWIYDHALEGGALSPGGALTDVQWASIESTIRAAQVEPPSRSAVDAMLADRQRG